MRAAEAPAATRRVRLTPRGAVLTLIVAALLLYLVVPVRTYLAQRGRLVELERQAQLLEEQTQILRDRVVQLHDPAYLEQLARECLGMIRPGEIGFVVVQEGSEPQAGNC